MTSTSPPSNYLTTKTTSLTSQSPVPPSEARAAQIPLQSFNLPTFPPDAFSAGLIALILTSDIKPDEYTSLLAQAFSIPALPPSIRNLSLELFSLGYPPGFLAELGRNLPGLRSLVVYAQLFAGTVQESRSDAVAFIGGLAALEEVHFLDVFASPGVFTELADALSSSASASAGVKFLEINYTYRHSDPKFLASVPSGEMSKVVGKLGKGLLGLTISVSAPDIVADDEEDREGTEVGIIPVAGKDARAIVASLVQDGGAGELVMLDLTMFELKVEEVGRVLSKSTKLKVLGFTVGLENGWNEVLGILGEKERGLEVLDIVGVPGEAMVERIKEDEAGGLLTDDLLRLLDGCKELKSLKVSILRTKTEEWVKEGTARS